MRNKINLSEADVYSKTAFQNGDFDNNDLYMSAQAIQYVAQKLKMWRNGLECKWNGNDLYIYDLTGNPRWKVEEPKNISSKYSSTDSEIGPQHIKVQGSVFRAIENGDFDVNDRAMKIPFILRLSNHRECAGQVMYGGYMTGVNRNVEHNNIISLVFGDFPIQQTNRYKILKQEGHVIPYGRFFRKDSNGNPVGRQVSRQKISEYIENYISEGGESGELAMEFVNGVNPDYAWNKDSRQPSPFMYIPRYLPKMYEPYERNGQLVYGTSPAPRYWDDKTHSIQKVVDSTGKIVPNNRTVDRYTSIPDLDGYEHIFEKSDYLNEKGSLNTKFLDGVVRDCQCLFTNANTAPADNESEMLNRGDFSYVNDEDDDPVTFVNYDNTYIPRVTRIGGKVSQKISDEYGMSDDQKKDRPHTDSYSVYDVLSPDVDKQEYDEDPDAQRFEKAKAFDAKAKARYKNYEDSEFEWLMKKQKEDEERKAKEEKKKDYQNRTQNGNGKKGKTNNVGKAVKNAVKRGKKNESYINRWCNLLEGVAPETIDANSYWHADSDEFCPHDLKEANMGTTYYRNQYPEEQLYNQIINVSFDDEIEMEDYNDELMSNGVEPLEEGENWVRNSDLAVYREVLNLQSPRIKADRNTIIKVTIG